MNKEAHYDHLHVTGKLKGISFWKRERMRWAAVKEMPMKRKILTFAPGIAIAVIGLLIVFLI